MRINYKITKAGLETLAKYSWLKSEYPIGTAGEVDEREITRLLENSHYAHIQRTLEQINKYGALSGEIGEIILSCNDPLNFSRCLAELSLFSYLYDNLKSKVVPIRRIQNQKSPDISINFKDIKILLEIYTPMDSYGYQVFSRLLTSSIINLQLQKGFNIDIDSKAENLHYTGEFPEFKEVYKWLDNFTIEFSRWLDNAKNGNVFSIESPSATVHLILHIKEIHTNPEIRIISWGEATRSTDTRLYFDIDNPSDFSKTDMGIKILDKLKKQQAGESQKQVYRILLINFSLTDTPDLSFLNEIKYQNRFIENIKFLVSEIKPYPPYDIVIPCELGFDCGFGKHVNLSSYTDPFINELIERTKMDKPIKEIPMASEDEVDELIKSL